MNYKGVIIEESLENPSILKDVKILDKKIEQVTPEHKIPQVKQWTLDTVEILEGKADSTAEKISKTIKAVWYADYKNDSYHYIIYSNKIFKVDRNNPDEYQEATAYGRSLGIPDYQVDFAPDTQVWER